METDYKIENDILYINHKNLISVIGGETTLLKKQSFIDLVKNDCLLNSAGKPLYYINNKYGVWIVFIKHHLLNNILSENNNIKNIKIINDDGSNFDKIFIKYINKFVEININLQIKNNKIIYSNIKNINI
tara:strand:+ start:85 stop:474 length:390 start_codon:yes stop_codon:yes gene_type:complete